MHKVRALEKDLRSRTEKIQDLQEKNLHAVVETPGGRRKQIPYRRQRMDIESLVSQSEVGEERNPTLLLFIQSQIGKVD